jgi:hypothetical protein
MKKQYKIGVLLLFMCFLIEERGMSEEVSPSIKIRCQYTECSDIKENASCTPRTKPVQSFDFYLSKKQVKENSTNTNTIIKISPSNIAFGRTYNDEGEYTIFPNDYKKISESYNFNRKSYNMTREVRIVLMQKDGDLDKKSIFGVVENIIYKGKCLPIATKE